MSLLDLKSDLSKFRKIQPDPIIEKKLPYKPVKTASNTTINIPNIKIPKFEKSVDVKSLQAKTIDYSKLKIGNRQYNVLNKLIRLTTTVSINESILPKISKLFGSTILPKISDFTKRLTTILTKKSLFKLSTPKSINHSSNFVKILPKTIQFISEYTKILPKLITHLSKYIYISPKVINKTSLFVKYDPKIIDKISLYIKQLPSVIRVRSLFTLSVPKQLNKVSLYKQTLFNNDSIYDTTEEIIARIKNARLYFFYVRPVGGVATVNYFNDLQSGAKGFTPFMKTTQFLGINGNQYTYPITVRDGRLLSLTSFINFYQDRSYVTFRNKLVSAKYQRIYNTPKNPYINSSGKLTNEEYGLYKWSQTRRSPSPLELIYTSYNLQDDSFQGMSIFGLRQPYILKGIQRKENPVPEPSLFGLETSRTSAAATDVIRIGKFLQSAKGLSFILKQIGLQKTNPKGINELYTKTVRQFDPTSIVTNIATQHLGIRVRRDGIPFIPSIMYSDIQNSLSVINSNQYLIANKLLLLKSELLDSSSLISVGSPIPSLSGLGGPQSVYGIGRTSIKRTINSRRLYYRNFGGDLFISSLNLYNSLKQYSVSFYRLDKQERLEMLNDSNKMKSRYSDTNLYSSTIDNYNLIKLRDKYIKDSSSNVNSMFRSSLASSTDTVNQYYSLDYNLLSSLAKQSSTTRIIKNYLLGVPSEYKWISAPVDYNNVAVKLPSYPAGRDLRDVNISTNEGIDIINVSRVLSSAESNKYDLDDYITFKFSNLEKTETVYFRSILVTFSENYNSEFKHINIIGRSDTAYLHSMFERTSNVVFKVACTSKAEVKPTWERLNKLANFTMPEYYSSADYRMKGPLTRITMGDLYDNEVCFISSLSYDIDEDTVWEIDKNHAQIPIYITVSMAITILNNNRPTNRSWNYGDKLKI